MVVVDYRFRRLLYTSIVAIINPPIPIVTAIQMIELAPPFPGENGLEVFDWFSSGLDGVGLVYVNVEIYVLVCNVKVRLSET